MNQKELVENIYIFLSKSNRSLHDLSLVLGCSPKYLKSKLHKMKKSKDESFSFQYFLVITEFFAVTLDDFIF